MLSSNKRIERHAEFNQLTIRGSLLSIFSQWHDHTLHNSGLLRQIKVRQWQVKILRFFKERNSTWNAYILHNFTLAGILKDKIVESGIKLKSSWMATKLNPELYSSSELNLSSQVSCDICVSMKKSSRSKFRPISKLELWAHISSLGVLSTLSWHELKINAQVQISAWSELEHFSQNIAVNTELYVNFLNYTQLWLNLNLCWKWTNGWPNKVSEKWGILLAQEL